MYVDFEVLPACQPNLDQGGHGDPLGLQLTEAALARENRQFRRTGGRSEENRGAGFHPAFLDASTRTIYASRFPDGRPAPFHLIDGLPDEIVVARHPCGRVAGIKACVVPGFVRHGCFYTREEAARCIAAQEY